MNYENDPELKEFLEGVKGDISDDRYEALSKILPDGFKTRNEFFETAGIDKSVLPKIEKAALKEDSLHEICSLLAPLLRKSLDVDLDVENAGENEIKFKRSEKQNVLDEIGMADDTTAQMMELMAKCYNDDKDEDWHQLSHLLLPYVDKFFAPAYRNAKEMGLTLEDKE